MIINKRFEEWLIGSNTNDDEKEKWIKEKLKEIENGKSILDAGAGELRWKEYCSHLKYVSQDFAQYNPNENETGLQIDGWEYPHIDIVSDITSIPVEDNSFDNVLCTEVFEHLPNPNKALEELIRITKIGGTLILTAPFTSLTHMAPYHFCTGFNKYWYKENLEANGCIIEECTSSGDFYSYLRQEILRLPYVAKRFNKYNSILLKIRCALFVHFLKKLIKVQNQSGDLLCFHYFIVAKKIK